MLDRSDLERQRMVLSSRLRSIEHELTALLAFHGRDERLRETPDPVDDLEEIVHPVLSSVIEIADELELEPAEESEYARARGAFSVLLVWLEEITPSQLARHWGIREQHPRWAQLHEQLLTALRQALSRLESSFEESAE